MAPGAGAPNEGAPANEGVPGAGAPAGRRQDEDRPRAVLRVAAAAIVRDGRLLATQRGYGELKDGWELPGGKLEPGETPAQAAVREIREELATDVVPVRAIVDVDQPHGGVLLRITCLLCTLAPGAPEPRLLEHEDARWLDAAHLADVVWLPADRRMVAVIRRQGLLS